LSRFASPNAISARLPTTGRRSLHGPWLYSQLHEATRHRLNVPEFLYDVNRQEPMHSHGPVMCLAFAYENELKLRLAYPIVNDLANSGVATYPAVGRDGKKPERPLIAGAQIQHENMALGSIAWYLRQMDFRATLMPWSGPQQGCSLASMRTSRGRRPSVDDLGARWHTQPPASRDSRQLEDLTA
jgi:hypothetical protein